MFGMKTKVLVDTKKVLNAVEKGAYRSFQHAAASIRKAAIASITRSKKPSAPGAPIKTRRGFARRAILYWSDTWGAEIGFSASKIDASMAVHEHGGTRGRTKFQKRPTMVPAMMSQLDRFASSWNGIVG